MNILSVIKRLRPKNLWQFFILAIRYPLCIIPTFLATRKCIQVATEQYGRSHHRNTPANAFRHAYWNYLIADYCLHAYHNLEKVIHWTQTITDWHEEVFINSALPKAMDLHNNAVGRHLFMKHYQESPETALTILLTMAKDSKKVQTLEEIAQSPLSLVHLIDFS
jgi:hypothetical protein